MSDKPLAERVEEGRRWLAAHDGDPPGRNYLWWKAGIIPGQRMGAHVTEQVKEEYATWHRAFTMWLRLYAQLEAENP